MSDVMQHISLREIVECLDLFAHPIVVSTQKLTRYGCDTRRCSDRCFSVAKQKANASSENILYCARHLVIDRVMHTSQR